MSIAQVQVALDNQAGGGRSNFRWTILVLIALFSFVSYVERINLSVVAKFIRDEYRLSDVQIGWSFSAFLTGYMLMQIPAGRLCDRFGPHRVLTWAAVAWALMTVLLGLSVGYLANTATQVVFALIFCRLLLGFVEAPTYPGTAAVIVRWFPPGQRGTPNALVQSASFAGEAATVIILAALVVSLGWRGAIFASAVPAILLALAWWRMGGDDPHRHPRVSLAERNEIGPAATSAVPRPRFRWSRLKERNVLALSASYFCHGYVIHLFFYWFFIYLVDERGFTIVSGGVAAAAPTISAALFGLLGGPLADHQARTRGALPGYRRIILAAAVVGAGFLVLGALAVNVYLAVGGFCLAIATRGLVESAYWSAAMDVGRKDTGTISGTMNMLGNLGGIVSTGMAPYLAQNFGWSSAFVIAALLTVAGGLVTLALWTSAVD